RGEKQAPRGPRWACHSGAGVIKKERSSRSEALEKLVLLVRIEALVEAAEVLEARARDEEIAEDELALVARAKRAARRVARGAPSDDARLREDGARDALDGGGSFPEDRGAADRRRAREATDRVLQALDEVRLGLAVVVKKEDVVASRAAKRLVSRARRLFRSHDDDLVLALKPRKRDERSRHGVVRARWDDDRDARGVLRGADSSERELWLRGLSLSARARELQNSEHAFSDDASRKLRSSVSAVSKEDRHLLCARSREVEHASEDLDLK